MDFRDDILNRFMEVGALRTKSEKEVTELLKDMSDMVQESNIDDLAKTEFERLREEVLMGFEH